jgi:hypothetical protein
MRFAFLNVSFVKSMCQKRKKRRVAETQLVILVYALMNLSVVKVYTQFE